MTNQEKKCNCGSVQFDYAGRCLACKSKIRLTNEKKSCCEKCFDEGVSQLSYGGCSNSKCLCHSPIDTEKKEENLIIDGISVTKGDDIILSDDSLFSSPSLETRERELWNNITDIGNFTVGEFHRLNIPENSPLCPDWYPESSYELDIDKTADYWLQRISAILEEKVKLCEENQPRLFSENKTIQGDYSVGFNEGKQVAINIIRGTEK